MEYGKLIDSPHFQQRRTICRSTARTVVRQGNAYQQEHKGSTSLWFWTGCSQEAQSPRVVWPSCCCTTNPHPVQPWPAGQSRASPAQLSLWSEHVYRPLSWLCHGSQQQRSAASCPKRDLVLISRVLSPSPRLHQWLLQTILRA